MAILNSISQLWHGAPNTNPTGLHTHTIVGDLPKVRKHQKKTRWTEGMHFLMNLPSNEDEKTKWYFKHVKEHYAIEKLGDYCPMHGGRPKKQVLTLLLGVPTPVGGKGWMFREAGLMFFTQPVVGLSASRNRTTITGLALLDHWAKKFPSFKRFVDAYVTDKARKEITLACVDFILGAVPVSMQEKKAEHDMRVEVVRQKRYQDQKAEQERQQAYFQMINDQNQLDLSAWSQRLVGTMGPAQSNTSALNAQSAYKAMLGAAQQANIGIFPSANNSKLAPAKKGF